MLCTNDTQLQSACFRQTQQGYAANLTTPAYFNPLNVLSRYIPPNFKTGYVQSTRLDVQRQLPCGVLADLAYVGNKSTHLQILADYNQATPCMLAGVTCGNLQARRPVSNFAGIEIAYGEGSANYNSLQFKLEKRATQGLYLLNSFTWGRLRYLLRPPRDGKRRQLARELCQPEPGLRSGRIRSAGGGHPLRASMTCRTVMAVGGGRYRPAS